VFGIIFLFSSLQTTCWLAYRIIAILSGVRFSHQNPEGSSVPIQLLPDLYENIRWRGIVLCAIFEVDKNLKNEDSLGQDSKSFLEFICRLDMDGGVVDSPLFFTFPKDKIYRPGSFGLWLYISHARFRGHLDVRG
jgi:hypothetical protein